MVDRRGQLRLFGVPYWAILMGLTAVAAVLIVALILHVPPRHAQIADWTPVDELLDQARSDWKQLFVVSSLLAVTLAITVLIVYSYIATREKLAEVQIASKSILESLAGGVLTLDLEGRLTIVNKAASQILEIREDPPFPTLAALGQKHPKLVEVVRQALLDEVYAQDWDWTFLNSANTLVHLRANVSPQTDDDGRRVGIVVLIKDVTNLVRMEQELRKRERLAAAGSLAAGIAHEIRNPLGALELNLRLLRDELRNPESSREEVDGYFEVLFAETRRLNRITSNFLQLSRPAPLVKTRLAVQKPVRQVVRLLETEALEKNVRIEVDLGGEEIPVLGEESKLEQVCLNILINAIQAMPQGGVARVTVRRQSGEDGEWAEIVFTDSGVGIPPENIPRLFDPYFTTRSDGTGLGLAIADRIVADHGGAISVTSSPGQGATLTVRLPVAREEETAGVSGESAWAARSWS
jgi:signal transduction histidine kinase